MQTNINLARGTGGYSSGAGHKYQFSIYNFGFAVFRDVVEVVDGGFKLRTHERFHYSFPASRYIVQQVPTVAAVVMDNSG
jgi:hypothetical protein